MEKTSDMFLDHFARLGVFSKVLSLAGSPEEEERPKPKEEKVSIVGLYYTVYLYPYSS